VKRYSLLLRVKNEKALLSKFPCMAQESQTQRAVFWANQDILTPLRNPFEPTEKSNA
jgi:hypothetical protein